MKKYIGTIFLTMLIFAFTVLQGQNIDSVVAGIKRGDAAQIAGNAGSAFSLTIMDKSSNFNKNEATQAIKEFFSKNVVKSFEIKHKGNSPNGQYAIGTLSTSKGYYRVNIFMKKEAGKEVIKELRFQLIE